MKRRWHLLSCGRQFLLFLFALLVLMLVFSTTHALGVKSFADDNDRRHSVWIVGDSLTTGLYASAEETTYRSLLFSALQEAYPGKFGTTFWSNVCTLAGFEYYWGTYDDRPDLIFIELGINDAGRNSHCMQVPKENWQNRYGAMLDRIRSDVPGVKIIVGTIPWSGWEEGSVGFEEVLQYNEWIAAEARKRQIEVADLWAAVVGRTDGLSSLWQASTFPPAYHGDGFHLNDIGHQLLASTFFRTDQIQENLLFLPLQYFGAR